ncbi:hypothetical protein Vretifemale_10782, partial [Volvox reticuliferus]
MFDLELFAVIQRTIGKKFTLDVDAMDDGSDRLCKLFTSPSCPFLDFDCSGHLIWLHPHPTKIYSYLQHYRKCKEFDPSTAVCAIVPATKGEFRGLLKGMTLLMTLPVGSKIYKRIHEGCEEPPPIPEPLEVWYDAPLS